MEAPSRPLLPNDVTDEELTWLLHNHARFHAYVDRLIAQAEVTLRQHINWEKTQ